MSLDARINTPHRPMYGCHSDLGRCTTACEFSNRHNERACEGCGRLEGESCPRCRVPLKPGIALEQTVAGGIPDFPGRNEIVTQTPGGPGRVIDCQKCPRCGWSQT